MKTLKVEGVYPMAFESEEDVRDSADYLRRRASRSNHLPRFIDSYNDEAPALGTATGNSAT